ncbi:GNAT family N-acetyltransferase [Candidatus Woesearchaeota archaeon]|nr:GNAT family N-acetyltransferase [Candidatus Woesearchaeota archaeon]
MLTFDIARLVAVDEKSGRIIGFAAAETFPYVSEEQARGKVAEVKKVNVHPEFRNAGVASQLYDARLEAITKAGYDFVVGTAVTGHPYSEMLSLRKGLKPAGFAPLLINADFTHTGQRESSLYMVKSVSDKAVSTVSSQKAVHIPSPAESIVGEAYKAIGLEYARDINTVSVIDPPSADLEWVTRALAQQGIDAAEAQPTLPMLTIDIANPERVGRVAAALVNGCIPVGVLPLGTDRIVMMYVPKRTRFDLSKVHMIPQAQSLASAVGGLYNAYAGRR